MKKGRLISEGTGYGCGIRTTLTIICIAGIFMLLSLVTPLSEAQSAESLPPLSEAALKFSPGKFVSKNLKQSRQFICLNELLLIDELILKTKKFGGYDVFKTPPVPKELQCRQIAVLLQEKEKTVDNLNYAIAGSYSLDFRKYDLLVELEIVDDLLLVQQDIESFLYHAVTEMNCKPMDRAQVKMVMSLQKKLLVRIKDGLLNALEAQQSD